MLGFFRKLEKRKEQIELSSHQQWTDFILRIANGEEPPEDEVLKALKDSGRTLEELQSKVELLNSRRQTVAEIATARQTQATRPRYVEELKAVEATFEKAKRAYEETSSPLNYRIQQIDRLDREIREQETELASTAGPELQAEIKAAKLEWGQIDQAIAQLTSSLETRKREAKGLIDRKHSNSPGAFAMEALDGNDRSRHALPEGKISHFESVQQDYNRKLKEIASTEAKIADLQVKRDQADAVVKALESRRLNPVEIF